MLCRRQIVVALLDLQCSSGKDDWPCLNGDGCAPLYTVCDGRANCKDKSDENKAACLNWHCAGNTRKCADNSLCITHAEVCDGRMHCQDGSDEMCDAYCLQNPLDHKTIVRRCSEDNTVCVPQEGYCDRVPDCPDASDEADCSCEDWDMHECSIEGTSMCFYKQWTGNKSVDAIHDHACENVLRQQELVTKQLLDYLGM